MTNAHGCVVQISPNGDEDDGHVVCYGQKVVLVDQHGHVWNNKHGYNGYMGTCMQRVRGSLSVVFTREQGARGEISLEHEDIVIETVSGNVPHCFALLWRALRV